MALPNKLQNAIDNNEFIITAEYVPERSLGIPLTGDSIPESITAASVADTPHGPALSSLAASMKLIELGVQPIWHLTTRDRNRIALQSEVLAAASLGIDAVMCMSGYHPALSDSPDSANVYDIDSVQLIDTVRRMRDESTLINGEAIDGSFDMTIGAVANPCLEPVELNIIKQIKKANAGAVFFQTQAVFDTACCSRWLNAVRKEGLHEKTAIIASILPLSSADEAESLLDRYTDFVIPENIIDRLKKAGGQEEQKIEGMAIFKETAAFLRGQEGIRGLHILSGGKEENIESYYKALDNQ